MDTPPALVANGSAPYSCGACPAGMTGTGRGPQGCSGCPITVSLSSTIGSSGDIPSSAPTSVFAKAAPVGSAGGFACPPQPLSFAWQVFADSAPAQLPNGTSTYAHVFVLPAGVIPPGATATFRLTVCYAQQPAQQALCGVASLSAPVRSSPLVVAISGGNVTLGSGRPVALSGASSTDPDSMPGRLSFLWTCAAAATGLPCAAPDGTPALLNATSPTQTLALASGPGGGAAYVLTLTVSKDVRSATATTTVTVVDGNPPVVFIPAVPQAINPSRRSSVLATVSSSAPASTLTTTWSVVSGPPLDLTDPSVVATPVSSVGLVFLPNALTPGSVHVLRLTASDANGVGFADVTLPVASTPWSPAGAPPPTVSVSPPAGTALVTDFTVSTAGWDPAGGSLEYQVSYLVVGGGGAPVTVSTFKPQAAIQNVTLPAGVAAGNFTVQMSVVAKVRHISYRFEGDMR